MDITRAKQITSSPVMANVMHNGVPIYIESIAGDGSTAWIHLLAEPHNRKQVSLSSLTEQ